MADRKSPLFLLVKDNISCNLFYHHYFQMIKEKVYLLLGNLDRLMNLNISFVDNILIIFIKILVLLKPDFNCCNSFVLS